MDLLQRLPHLPQASVNDSRGNAKRLIRTDDYTCIKIRVFFNESLNDGKSLVVFVRDGENNFKVGVFLVEGGFEILEQIRVETFQRA